MVGVGLFTRITLPPLWIADQVRNDGMVGLSCYHPLLPVSGTGTGFDPLSSRERGIDWLVWLVVAPHMPPCGYCLKASMTGIALPHRLDSRLRGNDGEFCRCFLIPYAQEYQCGV